MSTILKALHRLEREKSPDLERPLRQEVTDVPPRARRSLGWIPFAALVAGVAAGATLIWVWPDAVGRLAAMASGTPVPASDVVVLEPKLAPVLDAPIPRPRVTTRGFPAPPQQGVAAVPVAPRAKRSGPRSTRRSTRGRAQTDAELARADPSLSSSALASRVELVRRPPRALPPSDVVTPPEQRKPIERSAHVAASPPRPGAAQPDDTKATPAPTRAPSPAGTQVAAAPRHRVDTTPRPAVPAIRVERTEWHPQADRRVAVIEVAGRPEPLRLREGDAVGPLVVTSIEPSGVVFDHDGVSFRRRVGPGL